MMRGRGLLILLATLVVLLSGLSSLRRSSEKGATKPAATTTTAATSAQAPPARELQAVMPADATVKLAPGQRLALRVRSDTPDIASISGLGLKVAVGPDVPGELVLVAPAKGSFAVTLQIANRTVGKIVVSD